MLSPLYGQLSPLRVPTGGLPVPMSVADLALWLDATTGTYDATTGGNLVTANGAAVARWEDMSFNGRNFTQSTANNQPTLVSAGLNGKPTISFDGTNDFLGLSANSLLQNISAYTGFFVRKTKTSVSASEIVFVNSAGASTRFDFQTLSSNRPGMRVRRVTADSIASVLGTNSQSTAGTFELFTTFVNHSNTTGTLYKNSTELATNTSLLVSGNSSNEARFSSIGAFVTGNSFADIEVAEVLIYHAALNSTDRAKIETYLNKKWGIF